MSSEVARDEAMCGDVLCRSEDGKHRYLYSQDKKYRYRFEAKLSDKPGVCMFVILNPATEKGREKRKNHKTRDNCEFFAEREECGRLWICNVFAFRSRRPRFIKDDSLYYIGANNDEYLRKYAHKADKIVCAWGGGTRKAHRERSGSVANILTDEGLLSRIYRLGEKLTQNGQPFHASLRGKSRKDVTLVPYDAPLQ